MELQLKKILPLFLCVFFAPLVVHASSIVVPSNNIGLVGYWKFDEGSGSTAHDSSGDNYTGTISGSASWVTGKFGDALQFTSASQYVTTGYTIPAQSSATSFTWSTWIYNTSSGGTQVILGFRNGSTWLKLTPSALEYGSGSIISNTLPTGQWVQVIIVKNGSNFTYYENGAVIGTASNSGTVGSHTFYIGTDPGFSDGTPHYSIDDVRVYSRALSASEVAELYNVQSATIRTPTTSGLVGYWSLNEGSGASARDATADADIGALSGSTLPSWITGKTGTALSFDGSTSYVGIPDSSKLQLATPLSLTMWFKTTTTGDEGVVRKDTLSGTRYLYGFQMSNCVAGAGHLESEYFNGSCYAVASLNAVNDGQWHQATMTISGTTETLYIDGVSQGTVTIAGSQGVPTGEMDIGADPPYVGSGRSGFFDGAVDDVRIYDRMLAPSEVELLYDSGRTVINAGSQALTDGSSLGSGLVGLWTFDGKDMQQNVKDESGQGNNGYLFGFTSTTTSETIGKLGQALTFNGSSDYIHFGTLTDTPSSYMTLCSWVKTANANAQLILGLDRRSGSTVDEGIWELTSSGTQQFWDYTGSAYGFADVSHGGTTSNTAVDDGKWHQVCFVKNGTSGTYYTDGSADGTATAANNVSYGSGDWAVGVDYRQWQLSAPSYAFFQGGFDDIRVYNRALSASEIKQLYNLGK